MRLAPRSMQTRRYGAMKRLAGATHVCEEIAPRYGGNFVELEPGLTAEGGTRTMIGCHLNTASEGMTSYRAAKMTSFLAEHKRRPTAKRDGIAAWLRDEIEYLESIGIDRTEFGDGALSAYKNTLRELERGDDV